MRTYAAIWTTLSLWAALTAMPAASAECASMTFDDQSFTVCTVDPSLEKVRLFLNDDDGQRLGTFQNVVDHAKRDGQALVMAMNGGMYHADRRPVGLYIENGIELAPIVTREGPGNFGLLPNGVFCVLDDGSAQVVESRRFADTKQTCAYATQSGPMLVIDGQLHPRFIPGSGSRHVRNGVGVEKDGTLHFAISDRPVNFDVFGRLFRDALNTPNALFLDGSVSRLYAPMIDRNDIGFPLGPMIGVVD